MYKTSCLQLTILLLPQLIYVCSDDCANGGNSFCCTPPKIQFGILSMNGMGPRWALTFSCQDGYVLSGNNTIVCSDCGYWVVSGHCEPQPQLLTTAAPSEITTPEPTTSNVTAETTESQSTNESSVTTATLQSPTSNKGACNFWQSVLPTQPIVIALPTFIDYTHLTVLFNSTSPATFLKVMLTQNSTDITSEYYAYADYRSGNAGFELVIPGGTYYLVMTTTKTSPNVALCYNFESLQLPAPPDCAAGITIPPPVITTRYYYYTCEMDGVRTMPSGKAAVTYSKLTAATASANSFQTKTPKASTWSGDGALIGSGAYSVASGQLNHVYLSFQPFYGNGNPLPFNVSARSSI